MKHFMIISIILAVVSCKKDPLRKMTGEYSCEATNTYTLMGQPTSVTTYTDTITVTENNGNVYINGGWEYPRDSIVAGEQHQIGFYPSFGQFIFVTDSLYMYTWTGGLGGGSSTSRSCVKM